MTEHYPDNGCTHGGDCLVHPDAQGIHNRDDEDVCTVHVHLADPLTASSALLPPMVIRVDRRQGVQAPSATRTMFELDARKVVDALWASLPGGTLNCLVAEMLHRRASLLRVTMPEPKENA